MPNIQSSSYFIETLCPVWGWQTESGPFTSESEAETHADRYVRAFYPGSSVRIVTRDK